jgi:hypothetical protein
MVKSNYAKLIHANLTKLYQKLPPDMELRLPAHKEGQDYIMDAFGGSCRIQRDKLLWQGEKEEGPRGILVTLYALHASQEPLQLEPLKGFKEFPNSMPYAGAFASHSEQILTAHVSKLVAAKEKICGCLKGHPAPSTVGGDVAWIVHPLPKIALCYIFYLADDEFPASVTCLFSGNANHFLPIDGLADVGEYTSRRMLSLI